MLYRLLRRGGHVLSVRTGLPFRLFQDMRIEAHLWLVRWRNRWDPTFLARRRLLHAMREIKLHFGCGSRILPGWVNLDGWAVDGTSHVVDLRERLPFTDGACRLIFSEQTLEHFEMSEIERILQEFHRVLRPGGLVRLVVPDAERYAEAYVKGDLAWFQAVAGEWLAVPHSGPPTRAKGLSHLFLDHYHRVALDFETLEVLLKRAGFARVVRSTHLGSEEPELRVDADQGWRVLSSLYVEACKPGDGDHGPR